MANWQGAILTNKGRALQAKVEGGLCQLALTKLKTGDGTLAPGQTLEALTDLVSPKQNIAISAVVVDENQPGVVYVKGVLSNASLTTGYMVKELGLFATDPDDGEILYAVTVDSNPDYLQDNTSATVITEALKLAIAVSNTSDVTATLDPEGLLTVEDMDIHNADEDAHDGILQKVSTLLADIVTHLASSAAISISSLNTNSVFYRLLQYALTAAGVQYNFQNSNAWYICLGSLFGGLIIQGGYIERQGWSPGGADKTGTIDLPMTFPSFARFGVATAMGTSGAIGCSSVTKTTATIRTSGITNLYTYLLAFGY